MSFLQFFSGAMVLSAGLSSQGVPATQHGNHALQVNVPVVMACQKFLGHKQEAFLCYRKQAQLGNQAARFRLAQMYEQGVGTPKDVAHAFQLYHAMTNPWAEAKVGQMYASGAGVQKSCPRARVWLEKAARADNPLAQAQLRVWTKHQGLCPRA